MATTSEIAGQVDRWLRAIAAEVADVPAIAEIWDAESEDNRLRYALEWDELMDRFVHIRNLSLAHELSPSQSEQFHSLIAMLRSNVALLSKIGLSVPTGIQPS